MRILLIQPYITLHDPNGVLTEPLGLASLATYIDATLGDEVEVSILDLFALGHDRHRKMGKMYIKGISQREEILKLVGEFQPNIVGITCNFTAYFQDSLEVAELIRENLAEIVIVLGGAHVTMEAENILRNNTCIDYIVRGEGELTFCELITAIKDDEGVEKVKGVSYRSCYGQIVSNPDRDLVESLDSLPMPDRKFIDMQIYKETNATALPFARKNPAATIITSRGCPFNCIFCSTKTMWRRHWRARSPQNVVREIEYLYNEYDIREIAIEDDQFIIDRERVNEICDLIIQKNLNISLSIPAGTSIWLVGYDLLKKMKRAGFYRLCFPVETGNKNTLKFIRKPLDLAKVKETIRLTNRLGYWTQGNFILGFPYETKEEIMETIRYAYDSGLDYVIFYIAKPYAGSEMYEIYKKEGLLDTIVRSSHIERSDCDTKTIRAHELNKMYKTAVKGMLIHKAIFYMKPNNFFNYLLPKLRSIQDIKYVIKISFSLIKYRIMPILKGRF